MFVIPKLWVLDGCYPLIQVRTQFCLLSSAAAAAAPEMRPEQGLESSAYVGALHSNEEIELTTSNLCEVLIKYISIIHFTHYDQ